MWDAKRGQVIVESGVYRPVGMVDALDVLSFLQVQQVRVDRSGQCEQCHACELVQHHATGQMVCPLTYTTCQRRKLERLVAAYGTLCA